VTIPERDPGKTPSVKPVDEHIASFPREVRIDLEDLWRAVRAAAPTAQEVISYRIPAFKHQGQLVFFAAYKNHCSFYLVSKTVLERFRAELEPYEVSGTTIHLSPDNPLPAKLVERILRARIAENEGAKSGGRTLVLEEPK
jgi:uncharacterized protein YdhG (YjbR/CyaY superfamily)